MKINPTDRLVVFSLLYCGVLIAFRWCFFYPANLDKLFDLGFLLSGTTLLFFVWNLFLAALPYGFIRLTEHTNKQVLLAFLLALWLVFLPNAPYVISDLKHLRPRQFVPFWYDILTFFSCAATGLLLGGVSVAVAARRFRWHRWSASRQKCSLLLFPLCGFGIYLGRVLRWNSWDLVTRPFAILEDVFLLFTDHRSVMTVAAYCAVYGLFLWIATMGVMGKLDRRIRV